MSSFATMKSGWSLVLALFLFSRSSAFVESFQAHPSGTNNRDPLRRRVVRGGTAGRTPEQLRLRVRLWVLNPLAEGVTSNSYNNTSSTALRGSASLASPESWAEAERAWALESAVIPAVEEGPSASRHAPPLAAFLGPALSVALTLFFLFHTLLTGDGISDAFATMDFHAKFDVLTRISWFPGTFREAQVIVGLVMAVAAFAQALSGFGFGVLAIGAMSSMPWLLHSELYEVMTPVTATLGALVGFILLIPYAVAEGPATEDEPGLDWDEIAALLVPCTVLTPLGIKLGGVVDPVLGTRVLAVLIMGFVAYKLVPMVQEALGSADDPAVLEASAELKEGDNFLQTRTAAILLGSAAGVFGGAFDIQGPPLCVYGDAKGWSPAQFRNNILAVVCLNSAFVVAVDYFQGILGSFYYSYFCLTSLPGVLLGLVAGQYASERIDPVLFKNLVLLMCLGLGIQLLQVS